LRAYEYIYNTLKFVPEESCLPYIACSDDSDEGFCPFVRELTSCSITIGSSSAMQVNVCRTCSRNNNGDMNEKDCLAIVSHNGSIPNVTIAEFGSIEPGNIHAIQAEIFARCVNDVCFCVEYYLIFLSNL
jgi:cathepsin X